MITLAIDTSTDTASVALLNEEDVLGETFLNVGLQHSVFLLPAINALFSAAGLAAGDADLFACTIGPGSFTGLRVGAGTVKGLALATGNPAAGISTLEALAFNIADSGADVCPMLDALNGRIYTALYRNPCAGLPETIIPEAMTGVEDFLAGIGQDTVFLGSGARKYAGLIAAKLPGMGRLAPGQHQHVRAAAVGLLGLRRFRTGDCLDVGTFTPSYLQQSYAEIHAR